MSLYAITNMYGSNGVRMSVVGPSGSLYAPTAVAESLFVEPVTLPTDGTYTIIVDPQGSAVGSLTLMLFPVAPDVSVNAVANGAAVTTDLVAPGQRAFVNVAGSAGQRLAVNVTATNFGGTPDARVSVRRPDGTDLVTGQDLHLVLFVEPVTLPIDGTYTIVVDPVGRGTGTVTVGLFSFTDTTSSIVLGAPPVTVGTTTPGQRALLTFTGQAGRRVSLYADNGLIFETATVALRRPDGTNLFGPNPIGSLLFMPPQTLPVDGIYTIVYDPSGDLVSSTTLTAYDVPANQTSTLAPGAPPTSVALTTPGQAAVLGFDVAAGQQLFVSITGVTGLTQVTLARPVGSTFYGFNAGVRLIEPSALALAGHYTLTFGGSIAQLGTATVELLVAPPDIVVGATVNGAAVSLSLPQIGQRGVVNFTMAAARAVAVSIPTGSANLILKINGQTLSRDNTTYYYGVIAAGDYQLVVDPGGVEVGTYEVTLFDGIWQTQVTQPAMDGVVGPNSCVVWAGTYVNALAGWAVIVDGAPGTVPDPSGPLQSSRTYCAATLADGPHWIHIRGVLADGRTGPTAHHHFIWDRTAPAITNIVSPTHPDPNQSHPSRDFALSWTETDANAITNRWVTMSRTVDPDDDSSAETVALTGATYSGQVSADGKWYVSIIVRDVARNSATRTYTIWVDQPPAAPTITSASHPDPGASYPSGHLVATWEDGTAAANTAWSALVDHDPATVPSAVVTRTDPRIVVDLAAGTWWLHVRTRDPKGQWGPAAHFQVVVVAPAVRLTAPGQGDVLWGDVPVAGICGAPGTLTVSAAPPGSETWQVVGTVQAATGCAATWDSDQLGGGQPVWTDGAYRLRVTEAGGGLLANGPTVTLDNDSTPAERVGHDYRAGRLTLDEYVWLTFCASVCVNQVPSRYTAGASMSEVDTGASALLARYWDALSAGTRADIGEILNPEASPPQSISGKGSTRRPPGPNLAPGNLDCDLFGPYDCRYETTNFEILYRQGDVGPTSPGNPVPDYVYDMVSAAEAARNSYSTMGFAIPGVRTRIVVNPWMPFDCAGIAIPPLPGTPPVINIDANPACPGIRLAQHEYFHIVQYVYSVDITTNLWWMEASGEFGAHYAQLSPAPRASRCASTRGAWAHTSPIRSSRSTGRPAATRPTALSSWPSTWRSASVGSRASSGRGNTSGRATPRRRP